MPCDELRDRAAAIVPGVGLVIAVLSLALASPAEGSSRKDRADAVGPLDLAKASVTQSGRTTHLLLRTRGRWRVSQLAPKPQLQRVRPPSYLCLELRTAGGRSRSCFGTDRKGKPSLVRGKLAGNGKVRKYSGVPVKRIRRPNRRTIEAVFRSEAIGLRPGRFRWLAISGWNDPSCFPAEPPTDELPADEGPPGARRGWKAQRGTVSCLDRVPNRGSVKSKLRRPQIVGCTRDEQLVNRNGSRGKRRVALTFDDGPSQYTSRVIQILDRHRAKGTFYVLGSEVPGRASLLRRMLRRGHEIGNHTTNHATNASLADIATTNRRIRDAAGFTPCTFRPPGGALSSATANAAWQLGMSNVLWDVDTRDWQLPGPGAIEARLGDGLGDYEPPRSGAIHERAVSPAQNGSIILLHDGGGFRGQTVAALPGIIEELQRRGFRLVTVSRLLGERMRLKP